MKINIKLLFACATLAAGTGLLLSQQKSPTPDQTKPATSSKPSAATTNAVADYPIIGHIEKRDRTITIKAGPKETIYSVKSADGKVLCNNVTLEQLRAQSPDLHEFVKTAVAGNISNGASADSRIRITDGGIR
jgi:propanediol dehydratase small subunit